MTKENSLKTSSALGLSQIRSIADIPTALVEAEAECSALLKEIGYLAKANPALQPVLDLLQGRQQIVLDRLAQCRKVMLAKPVQAKGERIAGTTEAK